MAARVHHVDFAPVGLPLPGGRRSRKLGHLARCVRVDAGVEPDSWPRSFVLGLHEASETRSSNQPGLEGFRRPLLALHIDGPDFVRIEIVVVRGARGARHDLESKLELDERGCELLEHVWVTHQSLAETLRVTRIPVARALERLESEGLLSHSYGRIQVPDVAALRAWVDEHVPLRPVDRRRSRAPEPLHQNESGLRRCAAVPRRARFYSDSCEAATRHATSPALAPFQRSVDNRATSPPTASSSLWPHAG